MADDTWLARSEITQSGCPQSSKIRYAGWMENLSQQDQYQLMKGCLNEREWRLYAATEASGLAQEGSAR